ncbi:hypothetical protein GCM10025857_15230 [Alicyclobacillus contaminans]|nr:hypothetical protein GCM10025857_15230 [Alicyclobacillus contaminans]
MVAVDIATGEEYPVGDMRLWDEEKQAWRPHHFRECICVERRRMAKLLKSSQIPERYRDVGFRGFRVQGRPKCVREARDAALEYYQRFHEIRKTDANSIAIVGPPGSGKTHLLMAIANGLMRLGISVLYFPWVEGMEELRSDWDGLQARLDAMRQVDVLYIDDLYKGRETPTGFAREKIYGIINYRYSNRLPMMVSSELSFDDLFVVDAGIARRIWQPSKGFQVQMGLTPEEEAAGMELNYSLVVGREVETDGGRDNG